MKVCKNELCVFLYDDFNVSYEELHSEGEKPTINVNRSRVLTGNVLTTENIANIVICLTLLYLSFKKFKTKKMNIFGVYIVHSYEEYKTSYTKLTKSCSCFPYC